MIYSKEFLFGMLAFASLGRASHVEKRAAQLSTKTVIATITSSTIVSVPTTIDAGISVAGVTTIIPGALTMTFSFVPAYFYLETYTASTSQVITVSTSKITVTVTPSAPIKSSTTAKVTSSAKITAKSVVASTSSAASASASSSVDPLTGPYIDHWDGTTFYQTPGRQCLYQADPSQITGSSFQSTDNPTCQTDCQGDSHCISYSWKPSTLTCTKYTTTFDGLVTASTTSGVYFSDKYANPGYGQLNTGCNNPSL